jgi:parvulin-like peptidyl-prolyl isomerase
MKESEVSKPIKTNIGFVILKLNYIQPEQIKPLVEVKGQIEELLLDDNAKVTISKWIEDLKEKAFISIKE